MKIFFETNPIIDASIYVELGPSNLLFAHPHHDRSSKLFKLLQSQNDIAITSKTVKRETIKKIIQIAQDMHSQSPDKSQFSLLKAVGICLRNALDLFEVMRIDDADGQQYLQQTNDMAQYLTRLYDADHTPTRIKERARHAHSSQNSGMLEDDFSSEILSPYIKQLKDNATQLEKFVKNARFGKNSTDKIILADAIALKNMYNDPKFYICSRDKRFSLPCICPKA